jgi:predicted naringenin-chalcone synthase
MRFDWDDSHGKFAFSLAQEVPYVVGANAEDVVDRLLRPYRLRRSDIAHWIVHSGGKKVIDSIKINLGLTAHELRHTSDVLRDYGNVSSGSFLFSYERLLAEGVVRPGDRAVMMTMGPGSTIETALLRWSDSS